MSEDDLSRPLSGVLAQLTRDLTADARAERLEPVRCRDEEISRVIDILLRHGKNNPALVGPAGVGKTAIAEGLAQRLSGGGNVPLALRSARVLALDHVSLLAGTSYRGQYEERIRALVAEVSADPDVILFVDELHNLIGQGTAIGVAMDAANMLKPALVRGDFRVIGATTSEEYERWICGDPALERRFQRVLVNELSAEQTAEILNARRLRLERHHNVVISEEAIRAAIAITDEHQTDRRRPDRAIDALDEACAHLQAGVQYTVDTERLIVRRRELLRQLARQGEAPRHRADDQRPDEVETFARDGMAALERLGAEIEAIFVGGPAPQSTRPSRPSEPRPPQPPVAPPPSLADELASLDASLRDHLLTQGVVVRGADIARVVAVATGHQVTWIESLQSV
ncbi:MAG: AAA family ATPase [Gemmatimonadaceae bacterium]